jgi:hypothetical protein
VSTLEFLVQREPSSKISTIGKLYFRLAPTDGWTWLCWTLEDPEREVEGQPVEMWKIKGKTAIARGVYQVAITMSQRFKRLLPILKLVFGFEGVRIHGGNTAADTEGCILVAHHRVGPDRIQGTAIDDVMAILGTAGNHATITIERKASA